MIDPDARPDPEDTANAPADPPAHAGPDDDDAEPAFDIDLDPEDQGTAEAAAEQTD
ncbi:hypothetical protein WCD74_14295 [Actinomycetospora sp. OC33-EN08]|uniref:Uncharacterized protein n=1 Tax=Actinomycetospora aurantiaca TaxID=3129233 RepID=A0ABU8MNP7_9PSEU